MSTSSRELDVCTDTIAFRQALRAVLPHADKTKTGGDGTTALHRVRLAFGLAWVAVMATNGATSAIAWAPLTDEDGKLIDPIGRSDDQGMLPLEDVIVDWEPRHVRRILSMFPVTKGEKDGMTQVLSLRHDADGTDLEDISGMVEGDGMHCAFVPLSHGFPDVWGLVSAAMHAAGQPPHVKPLTTAGLHLLGFNAAAVAYESQLTIRPTGTAESRGFVVTVDGIDRFAGTIESRHQDDDSLKRRDSAQQRLLARLARRQLQAV